MFSPVLPEIKSLLLKRLSIIMFPSNKCWKQAMQMENACMGRSLVTELSLLLN